MYTKKIVKIQTKGQTNFTMMHEIQKELNIINDLKDNNLMYVVQVSLIISIYF